MFYMDKIKNGMAQDGISSQRYWSVLGYIIDQMHMEIFYPIYKCRTPSSKLFIPHDLS